jgi:Gram-negative bacterial TonB protein C-terminal
MRTHQGDSEVSVFVSTEVSRWHSTCTETGAAKIWDVDQASRNRLWRQDCSVNSLDRGSVLTIFPARSPLRASVVLRTPPSPRVGTSELFLLRRQSALSGFWESLRTLCSRTKFPMSVNSTYPFRSLNKEPSRLAGQPLGASFLVHCSVVLMLVYVPRTFPARKTPSNSRPSDSGKIYYYTFPPVTSAKLLPRIASTGPGAHAGSGSELDHFPILGSTASHADLTIISTPLHPDNSRQTIYQPSSPPDLRIKTELKLPDIAQRTLPEIPKLLPDLHLRDLKPLPPNEHIDSAAASLAPAIPTNPAVVLPEFGNVQPRLPVTTLAAPRKLRDNEQDRASADESLTEGHGLLIIGVDPSGEASKLILPGGYRWGEFSVSPAGGEPGSPGGSLTGSVVGGSGGNGPGGDESTGIGPGHDSGGGGITGSSGRITVSRSATTGNGSLELGLDPVGAERMVYLVPSATVPRRNAFVVSTGPRGGGGLEVYGALPCGKIYTVFLPMPGRTWTLQFCRTGERATSDARSATIHLEPALVPPDPELKFDFQRLPVPPDKAHKMIVLKGALREDGTVDKLQVYQGVVPQMDEAARIAFSRWTFKPAMSAGTPLRIEILVGIPIGAAELMPQRIAPAK